MSGVSFLDGNYERLASASIMAGLNWYKIVVLLEVALSCNYLNLPTSSYVQSWTGSKNETTPSR